MLLTKARSRQSALLAQCFRCLCCFMYVDMLCCVLHFCFSLLAAHSSQRLRRDLHTHTHTHVNICIYVIYIYIYIFIHTYIYIYTYIYKFILYVCIDIYISAVLPPALLLFAAFCVTALLTALLTHPHPRNRRAPPAACRFPCCRRSPIRAM